MQLFCKSARPDGEKMSTTTAPGKPAAEPKKPEGGEKKREKRTITEIRESKKTGEKMVFPLVVCIFPAIWIVTIGPAAIQFIKVLGPMGK